MESRAAADKRHQCRRPHGTYHNWTRHPEPSATRERPTSVVERRESPGLVFYPRPAPRRHIHPMSKPVRRPSSHNCARMPARTITRDVAPVAVFIQVFVPSHLPRNIVRRVGAIFPLVAFERPIVKRIPISHLVQVVIEMIRIASETRRLPRNHVVGKASAANVTTPMPRCDFCAVSVRA